MYVKFANKLMLSLLFHNFCSYDFHFYATAAYRNGNPTSLIIFHAVYYIIINVKT